MDGLRLRFTLSRGMVMILKERHFRHHQGGANASNVLCAPLILFRRQLARACKSKRTRRLTAKVLSRQREHATSFRAEKKFPHPRDISGTCFRHQELSVVPASTLTTRCLRRKRGSNNLAPVTVPNPSSGQASNCTAISSNTRTQGQ